MKRFLIASAMALTVSLPAFAAEIAAVRIHADWCPNCKALDPKLEAAFEALGDEYTVREVRLDYTKKDKDALWAAAEAERIREPLEAYVGGKVKTGLLILINEETGEVVGKATSKFSEAELAGALKAAASS